MRMKRMFFHCLGSSWFLPRIQNYCFAFWNPWNKKEHQLSKSRSENHVSPSDDLVSDVEPVHGVQFCHGEFEIVSH